MTIAEIRAAERLTTPRRDDRSRRRAATDRTRRVSDNGDDLGIVLGSGTCPPEVLAAVEQAIGRERVARRRPSTSETYAFFGEIAETIKRAGGDPR